MRLQSWSLFQLQSSRTTSYSSRTLYKKPTIFYHRQFTCSARRWKHRHQIPLPHEPDSYPLSAKLRDAAFGTQPEITKALDHISAGFRFRQNSFQWLRVQRASFENPEARELIVAYSFDIARRASADNIDPLLWGIVKGIILPGLVPSRLTSSLRLYNGIFQWHITHGAHPSRDFLEYGLVLALDHRNTTAIRQYVELLRASHFVSNKGLLLSQEILPAFPRYLQDDGIQSKTEREERKAEAEALVLDSAIFGHPLEGQEPDLIAGYLRLIGEVFGQEAMLQCWADFLQQDRWSRVLNDAKHPEHVVYKALVNACLRALASANAPRAAWQLLKSLNWQTEDLETKTWGLLLDYPEHISTWLPGMEEAVLKKHVYELEKIERALGYQWVGGENGEHIKRIHNHDFDSHIHKISCADFEEHYDVDPKLHL